MPAFESCPLKGGRLWLHVHPSRQYKSTTVDLFLPTLLRPVHATGLALVSRLLERGTAAWPGLRELNHYTDWLYGAGYYAATERIGAYQALRLHFDCVDEAYLPQPPAVLPAGFELLQGALRQPHAPDGCFDPDWVQQEKRAHQKALIAARADRGAYAFRRGLQIMCPNEPYCLSVDGDETEIDQFDAPRLSRLLEEHPRRTTGHVYVCGDVDPGQMVKQCETLDWPCERPPEPVPSTAVASQTPRRIVEPGDVSQGRLIVGYRGGAPIVDAEYASFLLLHLILGGDSGRLYRIVREEAGLCYHISSHIEPMPGYLFVEAGVEGDDLDRVVGLIEVQRAQIADAGPTDDELQSARRLALHRLDSLADHREGLVHFDLQRRLGGADTKRAALREALASVGPNDIRRQAANLTCAATFFLAPVEAQGRVVAA